MRRSVVALAMFAVSVAAAFAGGPTPSAAEGTPTLRWRFDTGAFPVGRPVVAGDLVVFGTAGPDRGMLHGVDRRTGGERWRFEAAQGGYDAVALAGGGVYARNGDGFLYAVESGTGAERWRVQLSEPAGSLAVPLVGNSLVYAAGGDGAIRALAIGTGAERWRQPANAEARPVLVAGLVVATATQDSIAAWDATTGAVRWTRSTGPVCYGLAADADNVYVPREDGVVMALDARTGRDLWQVGGRDPIVADLAVYGSKVYVERLDGSIAAIASTDGAVRWRVTTAGLVNPPVVAGSVVFASAGQGPCAGDVSRCSAVFALSESDGRVIWRFPTHAFQLSAPVVDGETLYVGGDSGALYAIGFSPSEITAASAVAPAPSPVASPGTGGTGSVRWRASGAHDAVAAAGLLFLVGDAGVRALDPATGVERWRADMPSPSTPVIAGSGLLVADGNGVLRSLDPATGRERWQKPGLGGASDLVLDGSTVYAAGNGAGTLNVAAVDPASGDFKWQRQWTNQSYRSGSLAAAGGRLYLVDEVRGPTRLWSIDEASGALGWEVIVAPNSAPVIFGDTVFVGSQFGEFLALAAADGNVRWRRPMSHDIGAPALAGETIVVGGGDAFCYAIDAVNGDPIWQARIGDVGGRPLVAGDVVYAGSGTVPALAGFVYALDASDGETRWRTETDAPVTSIRGDGGKLLVAVDAAGTVYGIDTGSGA